MKTIIQSLKYIHAALLSYYILLSFYLMWTIDAYEQIADTFLYKDLIQNE